MVSNHNFWLTLLNCLKACSSNCLLTTLVIFPIALDWSSFYEAKLLVRQPNHLLFLTSLSYTLYKMLARQSKVGVTSSLLSDGNTVLVSSISLWLAVVLKRGCFFLPKICIPSNARWSRSEDWISCIFTRSSSSSKFCKGGHVFLNFFSWQPTHFLWIFYWVFGLGYRRGWWAAYVTHCNHMVSPYIS